MSKKINRREFLKKFGMITAVAVATPGIIAEALAATEKPKEFKGIFNSIKNTPDAVSYEDFNYEEFDKWTEQIFNPKNNNQRRDAIVLLTSDDFKFLRKINAIDDKGKIINREVMADNIHKIRFMGGMHGKLL